MITPKQALSCKMNALYSVVDEPESNRPRLCGCKCYQIDKNPTHWERLVLSESGPVSANLFVQIDFPTVRSLQNWEESTKKSIEVFG